MLPGKTTGNKQNGVYFAYKQLFNRQQQPAVRSGHVRNRKNPKI